MSQDLKKNNVMIENTLHAGVKKNDGLPWSQNIINNFLKH